MANAIIDTLLNPATIIREKEQNTIAATRNHLLKNAEAVFGSLPNGTIGAAGNIKGVNNRILTDPANDATDTFSFTVDRPTRLDAKLISNNEKGIGFNLVKDFTNDGEKNFGANFEDLLAASFIPGADDIQFDRLEPGTYFLEVTKPADPTTSIDYTLIPKASPIANARLNVEIDRVIPLNRLGNVVVQATIDGFTQQTQPFGSGGNQGIILSRAVDPNKREVNVKLNAFKVDASGKRSLRAAAVGGSPLDLNAKLGKTELEFTYDTLTREVKGETGFGFFGKENATIRQTVRGDGEGTSSGIKVSYDSFTVPDVIVGNQPAVLQANNIPVIRGSNGKDPMQGSSNSGILFALGGDDRVNSRGGDDIVDGGSGKDVITGGTGNDILIGGTGNDRIFGNSGDDLLDGGRGSDLLVGGAGVDTFVLARGNGNDIIQDFRNGQDFIGLGGGLAAGDLKFVQQGGSTIIQTGQEQLAILRGVRPSALDLGDFKSISTLSLLEAIVPIVA
ncbi:calcium-binding protein [Leptolyngbya ohadii]|uniref:calcium-binding protein n=1 Tax=Leptolyngbya ohadii TaxID=1962290 RepID=UPI000B59B154|nr:calcium-binding protein [Leptolyngbya ohadii]